MKMRQPQGRTMEQWEADEARMLEMAGEAIGMEKYAPERAGALGEFEHHYTFFIGYDPVTGDVAHVGRIDHDPSVPLEIDEHAFNIADRLAEALGAPVPGVTNLCHDEVARITFVQSRKPDGELRLKQVTEGGPQPPAEFWAGKEAVTIGVRPRGDK